MATFSQKRIPLPSLTTVSQGTSPLHQENIYDVSRAKPDGINLSGIQSHPQASRSPSDLTGNEFTFTDAAKVFGDLAPSPKRASLKHIIKTLGLKPAVFYSLRPDKPPEMKTTVTTPPPKKIYMKITKLPNLQNSSSKSISSLTALTPEANKQANPPVKPKTQSLRSPKAERMGSLSKSILKKAGSKTPGVIKKISYSSWSDLDYDSPMKRKVRFAIDCSQSEDI